MNACVRVLLIWLVAAITRADVVRIEIAERGLFAAGEAFGAAGPYEVVRGRALLETDPDNAANRRVHDLSRAARNPRGRVETWTDFCLLKPVEPAKGNGLLLYEFNNRGNMLALWTFNDGDRTNDPRTRSHAGHGFLMRHGFSVLWCGWNGDVQDDGTRRLRCGLPIATENGRTITGLAHLELSTTERIFTRPFSWSPWGIGAAFPTVSLDDQEATLTMRPRRDADGIRLPRDAWAFARREEGRTIPDATHVTVHEGFRPGWLYDVVYNARDPRVSGLGLTAVRDCVSFFRHGDAPDNPLAGAVRKACAFGISQAGRAVHHFLFEGFNADERGRTVFDGALIHVAGAGKGGFNHRFRMCTDYGTQHEGHLSGSDLFPFAPLTQTDPVTGASGDSLARSRSSGHSPQIIFTQTSTEYWSRAASLLHTDVEGARDLVLPDDVRIYLVAGAQHYGKGDGTPGTCQQPRNTLDDRGPVLRALLVRLSEWVNGGAPPPPSRHPRLGDRTLVDFDAWHATFPRIPGHRLPTHAYQPPRLDFGMRFETEGIADVVPPRIGKPFRTLVPAVNADGNETSGIVLPDIAVPLGTHAGWNLRAPQAGADTMLSSLDGMFVPFAETAAERRRTGDPRPSLEERYPSKEVYLSRLAAAAGRLRDEGLLLDEDVARISARAAAR